MCILFRVVIYLLLFVFVNVFILLVFIVKFVRTSIHSILVWQDFEAR